MNEILKVLHGLPRRKLIAFTSTTVDRLRPIVARFATRRVVEIFDEGLKLSWDSVESEKDLWEVDLILKKINDLPESQVEESDEPEFYVMSMLALLAYNLEVIRDREPEKYAGWVSGKAMNLLSGFDYYLEGPKGRIVTIDPHKPKDRGELESDEIDAQLTALTILRNYVDVNNEMIEGLRLEIDSRSHKLTSLMPEIVQKAGWAE